MRSKSASAPKRAAKARRSVNGLISMAGKRNVLAPRAASRRHSGIACCCGLSHENAETVQREHCVRRCAAAAAGRARPRPARARRAPRREACASGRAAGDRVAQQPRAVGFRNQALERQAIRIDVRVARRSAIGSCRPAAARRRVPPPWRCGWRRHRAREEHRATCRSEDAAFDADDALDSPRAARRAGSRRAAMRDSSPRRIRPAQASMIASNSPASRRRRRVSTLPRSGSMRRSGRAANNCA